MMFRLLVVSMFKAMGMLLVLLLSEPYATQCFKEVVFDCERSTSRFLYVIGNGQNAFSVEGCRFINISEIELLKPRNMLNPVVRGCEFCGLLREGGRTKEPYSECLLEKEVEEWADVGGTEGVVLRAL